MEKILEKLFDIKRIPSKFIFVIWISCALILFVPKNILKRLSLDVFLQEFGKYIGISFIITSALLFVTLVNFVGQIISRNKRKRITEKEIIQDVNSLDHHEKSLLREFFIQGKNTLQLPFDNETVVGLANKGIIYQASSTGFTYVHGVYFPYSITEIAKKKLTYEAIELPKEPSEDDKRNLWEKRPTWAKLRSTIEDRSNSSWF